MQYQSGFFIATQAADNTNARSGTECEKNQQNDERNDCGQAHITSVRFEFLKFINEGANGEEKHSPNYYNAYRTAKGRKIEPVQLFSISASSGDIADPTKERRCHSAWSRFAQSVRTLRV